MRAAYGTQSFIDQGLTGAGKTIVIIDAYGSSTIDSDLAIFDTAWGLPAPSFTKIAPFGIDPTSFANKVGWSGETTLDVEWAHAVAPGANITLVLAKSNADQDILDATQYALDHKLGDVLSQSYGEAEQCVDPALAATSTKSSTRWWQGMDAVRIVGRRRFGQPTCDGSSLFQAASNPASDPDVTGVGGTTLSARR